MTESTSDQHAAPASRRGRFGSPSEGWSEDRLHKLLEAAREMNESLGDLQGILDAAARSAVAIVGDSCVIRTIPPGDAFFEVRAISAFDPTTERLMRDLFTRFPQPAEGGINGRVLATGESVVIPEIDPLAMRQEIPAEYHPIFDASPIHGLIAVPLRARSRNLGTMLITRNSAGRPYTDQDVEVLEVLASRAALTLENAMLLAQSEESLLRYQGIFSGAGSAILVCRADRQYTEANQAAELLTGYSRDELLTMKVEDIVSNEPVQTARHFDEFRRAGQERGVISIRRKDGAIIPCEYHATQVDLEDGPTFISALADITDRLALDRLRQDFIAMVAHDLKSPLTALRAQAQVMARREPDLDEPTRAIIHQVDKMTRLIEGLSDIIRIESARLHLDLAPASLDDIVLHAIATAESPSNPVRFIPSGAPVVGQFDALRLEQLVANLIDNAVKYSFPGRPVDVEVREVDGEAELAVVDTGIGIAPEHLPVLFERFFRADHARGGGLGLGLYISRLLAEAHGGRIWAESVLGEGTRMVVRLPLDGVGEQTGEE